MDLAKTYKQTRKRHQFALLMVCVLVLIGAWGLGWYDEEMSLIEDEEEEEVLSDIPYAKYFMKYAPEIGWDWELLAAVAYHESRYNPQATSRGGACGLMQLVPRTATKFGLNDSTKYEPEDNIRAGVKYIARLQEKYRHIPDSVERIHFVLASYNAGTAHIMDARRLAREYGGNPDKWFGETEYWCSQLNEEAYYTDSVVLYGQFKSGETRAYVKNVLRTYRQILEEED